MTTLTTFACGGAAACIAEIATLPIDTTKVRLQLLSEYNVRPPSMIAVARGIVRDEGVRGLFKGLAPALQRQIVFASLRIGLYAEISNRMREPGAPTLSLARKILAGLLSGAIGITVANPTDLVKVRMQSEGRLAQGVRPRYSGVFNAYATIVRTEGVLGLWTGLGPAIMRNSIINATELASYEQSKEYLRANGMSDGLPLHLASATAAGLAATIVGSPVDVVKTRVMAARRAAETAGGPAAMGAVECVSKMLRTEGLGAFYKGVTPAFFRLTGWSIVMFVTLEQLKLAFAVK